ncbi:MAG: LLM class flavin-dependent oxidoreductase [Candidatus Odinarchaeum yellowstonii]|uniref:LLM class flavin-dependent oxidoreductase n=1 Tax=Odinarchaeota yellowstonii (strain LCB_4) TaxID=1841599 RepID=A0AAF0IBS7_ODILC|nr:MAG: LLM class flavin-dependent oxidoreductase [Candidatus Odinarchaeum yellowstonii]
MVYIVKERKIKFGLELLPDGGVKKPYELIFEYAKIADKWFDNIWLTHHPWNADPFTTAGYMASITRYTTIGLGATNPFVIPPVYIAETSGTLFRLYSKRFILGVGAGDPESLDYIGVKRPPKLIKYFREAISEIRDLLSGKPVRGRKFSWFHVDDEDTDIKPKIFIAAQGPMMLRLAGEIGDGVLINASHPLHIRKSIERVVEGALRVKRPIIPEIVAYTCFSMDEDAEKALAASKPPVAYIVSGASDEILREFDIDTNKVEAIRSFLRNKRFIDAFNLVDERMIEFFSISGDPVNCRRKIEEIVEIGVDQIVLGSPLGVEVEEVWRGKVVYSKEAVLKAIIRKILCKYPRG